MKPQATIFLITFLLLHFSPSLTAPILLGSRQARNYTTILWKHTPDRDCEHDWQIIFRYHWHSITYRNPDFQGEASLNETTDTLTIGSNFFNNGCWKGYSFGRQHQHRELVSICGMPSKINTHMNITEEHILEQESAYTHEEITLYGQPLTQNGTQVIQWTVLKSNSTWMAMVDFHNNKTKIMEEYRSRVEFNETINSITLRNVSTQDNTRYKSTVGIHDGFTYQLNISDPPAPISKVKRTENSALPVLGGVLLALVIVAGAMVVIYQMALHLL